MFLSDIEPASLAQRVRSAMDDLSRAASRPVELRLAFPTVIRLWDEPLLKRWFAAFAGQGLVRYEVGNPGALSLVEDWRLTEQGVRPDLASDFTLYALNTLAARVWSSRGLSKIALSIENDAADLRTQLGRWPVEAAAPQAILFKDTPLFIAESCSLTALHDGCPTAAVCGYRTLEVENDEGERFYVAHENCKSVVYGKEAFSLTQERRFFEDLGVKDFRVDLLTRPYSTEQVHAILRATQRCESIPGTHAANFHRRLL